MSCWLRQTGLDSSTTFQIVRSIANVAHFRDATILVSLLQVREGFNASMPRTPFAPRHTYI